MCGIAGFVSKKDLSPELKKMSEWIANRGPDGSGEKLVKSGEVNFGFAHRRLSIIDVAGGHQPFSDSSNSVLVFNGEIFNFEKLRENLREKGIEFVTKSDTEVLFHWLKVFGVSGLSHLNGMFAFCFYDGHSGDWILARDRSGIKPLFYSDEFSHSILFSSSLNSLLATNLIPKRVDPQSLSQFLFLDSVPAPNSMILGVKKLPPGSFLLRASDGTLKIDKFWQLKEAESFSGSYEEAKHKFNSLFRESVRRQLISDVPVGVYLSGGIDSSLVAGVATEVLGHPLKTFSVGFEEDSFDESSQAKWFASRIKSEHKEILFRESDVLDLFQSSFKFLDEPFGDPSYLPTYLLTKFSAQEVKVALGGDGGDELFGGYPTYRAASMARIYGALPSYFKKEFLPNLVNRLPVSETYQSLEWKLKRFVGRWEDPFLKRHLSWMSATDFTSVERLLRNKLDPLGQSGDWLQPKFKDYQTSLMALDFISYMPGSVLTKVDRSSMANGVEVRPPFLDNEIIQFAFSIPSSWKVSAGQTKKILRDAASAMLPTEILSRKKKGFGIPLARWMRTCFRHELEKISKDSLLYDFVEPIEFKRLLDSHLNGTHDSSKTLWSILLFHRWVRENL